jgi:hypothetical protein
MTEKKTGAASGDLGVMEGKGFYNRHSRPQRGAVAFGLPLLEHAIGTVPLPAGRGLRRGRWKQLHRVDANDHRRGQAPPVRRARRLRLPHRPAHQRIRHVVHPAGLS